MTQPKKKNNPAKPKARNTTKKQFGDFCDWIAHYLDFFGLKDWDVRFKFVQLPQGQEAQAEYNESSRWVQFSLTRSCEDGVSARDCALHEVVHVMLVPLVSLAEKRFCAKSELDLAEEKVVVLLTNLVENLEDK